MDVLGRTRSASCERSSHRMLVVALTRYFKMHWKVENVFVLYFVGASAATRTMLLLHKINCITLKSFAPTAICDLVHATPITNDRHYLGFTTAFRCR